MADSMILPERAQSPPDNAANFFMFSVPNPAALPEPVPLVPVIPQLPMAIKVHESLHRFQLQVSTDACGFEVVKAIDNREVATVSMQMTPMPDDFEAAEDRVPPPTLLIPLLSQRFCALKGEMEFNDGQGSGFRAFGTGRTFPTRGGGSLGLLLAATLDITEGFGAFAGMSGTGIVNGYTVPPDDFNFNVLFRILDPQGRLKAHNPIPPLIHPYDPAPTTAFLGFIAHQAAPLEISRTAGGALMIHVRQILQLVDIRWSLNGPVSRTTAGEVVGVYEAVWVLNTLEESGDLATPGSVIPAYSTGGRFTFRDRKGQSLGSVDADMVEGRVFPTLEAGSNRLVYRIGGVAPPHAGTGQFIEPSGMISINGSFSLERSEASVVYVMRLADPVKRFQSAAAAAQSDNPVLVGAGQ